MREKSKTDQTFDEIIEENFPKLRKDIPIQAQETHRAQIKKDGKRKSPWHIIPKRWHTEWRKHRECCQGEV